MATRRSRLQVKPNILGGPKGPGPKSAPKTPVKDADKESTSRVEANDDKNSKKNIQINAIEKRSNDKEGIKDETQTATAIHDVKEDKTNIEKLETETVIPDVSKTDIPTLPTRARLRKFGKVNISAARGTTSKPQPEKVTEKQPTENAITEQLKCDSESNKATNDRKKEDNSVEKKDAEDGSKTNAVVQRRSRFPKAKPNLADAGRRRQKEPSNKEVTSGVSSESPEKIPQILVSEPDVKPSPLKSETTESLPSTPTMTQLQPRPQATLTSILKSPLKHPTPTIPLSPEKRARTLSTSEPQVVKRQRKPKVTAPTDQPPDRTTMKMRDLIRWNPSNNPMKPKVKAGTAVIAKAAEKENVEEEVVTGKEVEVTQVEKEPEPEDTSLPVPQVTIGPDGNIVINEKSLIVKGPEVGKDVRKDDDIIDETDMFTTYGSFRTRNLSKRWSKKDTKKFYKALAMIGIDFFLINQLFPTRTRLEIKKKFKKEEKVNKALVDKVLKERINFDPTVFDVNDESSDEEEPKGKKETKKKEKKITPKDKNNTKGSATKRTSKRKRIRKNFYEDDDTTSEEEEENPIPRKSTKRGSGPSVSQKDGEVVDILMDMSKGRIRGDGLGSGLLDTSGKLTAVPASNVHGRGSFIPIEAKTSKSRSQNNQNSSIENVPIDIPGIQSISIMQTQKIEAGPSVKIPVLNSEAMAMTKRTGSSMQTTDYSDSENSNRRIYLPDLNTTNSTVQSNIQPTASVFNQVQYNQTEYTQSVLGTSSSQLQQEIGHVQLQSGTSLTQLQQATSLLQPGSSLNQLQPGTSQNQLQQVQVNSMPIISSSQISSEDADQYVLVTVMPEGGGETVIHIYRLHGGDQSQNQVLYADAHSSQQMMVDNINAVDQHPEQASIDVPLTVSDSQMVDGTQSDTAALHIATEVVSEISNTATQHVQTAETQVKNDLISTQQSDYEGIVETQQSDSQLTSGNEKLLMQQSYAGGSWPDDALLNGLEKQVLINNENESDTKNDITGEVSEVTVKTDALSENDFTKLNTVEIENG